MTDATGAEGLSDRPVLTLDPGGHTAMINRADVDAAGTTIVTGSEDKTVRLWSAETGALIRTIRVPVGPGNIGKIYAVAISPDGGTVAAGGWTRTGDQQLYLFHARTGAMTGRIEGLPNVVNHLAFSPHGTRLVATLGGANGIRLYARRDGAWREIARDTDYESDSYGAAFAPDGRFATTSLDGHLRLYDPDGTRRRSVETDFEQPFGLAFDPDGARLAVGFDEATAVRLFDGRTLAALPTPDTDGIDNGSLSSVAWSADGRTLYAGGQYDEDDMSPVVAWAEGGHGPRRVLPAGLTTITSLRTLADGTLIVAAGDPWLGRLDPDGTPRWTQAAVQADFRDQQCTLAVSADGMAVDFGFEVRGHDRARFDVGALSLRRDPPEDKRIAPPEQDTLPVADWFDSTTPTLAGTALPLERYEISRSLAIHPDADRFVLGTEWYLRAFDIEGAALWQRAAPGTVWAVAISGDGRLVIAAYADGTIRWHRMDDGEELLALFPLADRSNWVAWTPEGVYAATPGAYGVLGWVVNRGWDAAADFVAVSDIPETNRPEAIRHVLPQGGTPDALAVVEMARIRGAVQRATRAAVAPGARLHVLTIGISDYGPAARHLALKFAHHDARDLAAALSSVQSSFYAEVRLQCLRDAEATRREILTSLRAIRSAMATGDLAVVLFSGHGALVDGTLYLLPHGVDAATPTAIEDTALPIEKFKNEIAAIAAHGRVLVLLDCCRSGASADGTGFALDARSLRAMLDAANVNVLTACERDERAIEDADWQNGAFTEALLEALGHADRNHDGLISVNDLSDYLSRRVPELTGGRQHPDQQLRFNADILLAAPVG